MPEELGTGERLARLEVRMADLEGDVTQLGARLDAHASTTATGINDIRELLHRRPTWGVTFALGLLSSVSTGLGVALLAGVGAT